MSLDQEALAVALFSRLTSSISGLAYSSRRFTGWENVPDHPALFLELTGRTGDSRKGLPTVWTLSFDLAISYRLPEDPAVAPDTPQADIVLKVEKALERTKLEEALAGSPFMDTPDDPRTTLGGLCSHCAIQGEIDADAGTMGGFGVVVIPIEILATA